MWESASVNFEDVPYDSTMGVRVGVIIYMKIQSSGETVPIKSGCMKPWSGKIKGQFERERERQSKSVQKQ